MDSNEIPPSFHSGPPSPTPPPLSPPPLITPQAPARQPKRGRGWMILAIVLLVFLGFSMLLNLAQIGGGGSTMSGHRKMAGPRLDETVLEDNGSREKIAVINVDGIITSNPLDQSGFTMVDLIKSQLERAKNDSNVKAVILRVDSPGGEVLASDEINRIITDFQEETGKPVVASMGNLAASGGYYISAPCRWIVANELTITGSIGVIMSTWNYRGLMNKVGLQPQVYKSGKFKDMLSGERDPSEIPPEERAMIQSLIDETFGKFKEVVSRGRKSAHEENEDEGRPLAENWAEFADGRVLSGSQAYELGFVDQLGNFDDAVEKASELGGVTSPKGANIIRYQQRYDLSDLFNLFGQSEARVVRIDLGMDAPKLRAGQLYFLSPTFLH